MSYKIGILITHPVQYYSPWFKHLDKKLDLEVFYTVKQTAKGQADAGFGVEFEWDTNLLEGYKYRWLENVSKNPDVNSFFGSDTPEIYKIIENKKFDAFLIIGWNYKSAIQATYACKKNGIPVFMRGDSHLLTERSFLKRLLKYIPFRIFLHMFNHLYVGKLNKEYLIYYGVSEKKLFFVPQFVDNQFFSEKSQNCRERNINKVIRKSHNIPENSFVILFVGKLIDKKRPDDLINACILIFDSNPEINIHLLIVGDGPLKHSLEDQNFKYKDRIHFAGFINQTELPCYYTASDVLALPSDGRETWGLVVNEAMACGIPAIVSDNVGCAPDLIINGKTGFIYPNSQTSSLAQCILKIKEILTSQKNDIQNNISEVMSIYNIENASENLFSAIAKSHRKLL